MHSMAIACTRRWARRTAVAHGVLAMPRVAVGRFSHLWRAHIHRNRRRAMRGRLGEPSLPKRNRAESPAHTSVGQRPTYGTPHEFKAVSLAHFSGYAVRLFTMCKAFSLDGFARRNVGRCPTLICVALSGQRQVMRIRAESPSKVACRVSRRWATVGAAVSPPRLGAHTAAAQRC